MFGCRVGICFPVVELLDWAGCETELLDDPNPFALAALAHLQQTERHIR